MDLRNFTRETYFGLNAEETISQIKSWAENAIHDNGESTPADAHPEENQDAWLCYPEQGIAVVFDGMGGYAGGADASTAAVGGICAMLPELDTYKERSKWAQDAFQNASDNVRMSKRFASSFGARQQDATGAMLCIDGEKAYTLSEGDSRVYRLRDGKLEKLTSDRFINTYDPEAVEAEKLLDEGSTIEEFQGKELATRWFRHRNRVDSAMSMMNFPTVTTHDARPGDLFILTTDGVHDNLTGYEMAILADAVWAQTQNEQRVAQALVEASRARAREEAFRSKDDDITACCLGV